MTARVLVVDDIEANVRLLEAKLQAEYYTVLPAYCGDHALARARQDQPDIILLDVMMPDMDGFEVCRRLKADTLTRHIPIVMVTALDGRPDRIKGLEAGADDFLHKPIDDVALMARVKSLSRMKAQTDELRARELSARKLGVIDHALADDDGLQGRVLLIDDNPRQIRRVVETLGRSQRVFALGDDLGPGGQASCDVLIVSVAAERFDGLKVCATLRSGEATRGLPVLAICDTDAPGRALKALELGAHDIIYRPVDAEELSARTRTLIRRKRQQDELRRALDQSVELAVTDQLTGLHNRRYMQMQLESHVKRASRGGDPVSLAICDIDFFKKVNDTWGHDVGDEVIREFARRIQQNFRPLDVCCRFGGEEFVVILPTTRSDFACAVADRLRRAVAGVPFSIRQGREHITVTCSVGVATSLGPDELPERLLKRADEALYSAKQTGRNRVVAKAA